MESYRKNVVNAENLERLRNYVHDIKNVASWKVARQLLDILDTKMKTSTLEHSTSCLKDIKKGEKRGK